MTAINHKVLQIDRTSFLDEPFATIQHLVDTHKPKLVDREFGTVTFASQGIARVQGLFGVQAEELVVFAEGGKGWRSIWTMTKSV